MFDFKIAIIVFLSLLLVGGGFITSLRLNIAENAVSTCQMKINDQNYAIEEMEKESSKNLAAQKLREKKALAQSEVINKETMETMKETIKPGCDAAFNYLKQAAK